MNENKTLICHDLWRALRKTRQFHDLIDIDYIKDGEEELVVAHFVGGGKREINVTLDSGWAMIKDIVRYIDG